MRNLLTIALISTLAGPLGATEIFQGQDIEPMVRLFEKQVVTLKKSTTTYNWASQYSDSAGWSQSVWARERPQDDPELLKAVQDLAGSFWRAFGTKANIGYMYGFGLYTAIDPVSTQSYGGEDSDWRLTQITFPAGTKMLDFENSKLVESSDSKLIADARQVEMLFGCSATSKANDYFENFGNYDMSPECRWLVFHVFNDLLKVDALAYAYNRSKFKECRSSYFSNRAFVIMRPESLTSSNVHVYNAESRLNEPERIRIQTLFSKSVSDEAPPISWASWIANSLSRKPQESVITPEGLPKGYLLWPDLVGKPQSPDIVPWLRHNFFGCDGRLPYSQR